MASSYLLLLSIHVLSHQSETKLTQLIVITCWVCIYSFSVINFRVSFKRASIKLACLGVELNQSFVILSCTLQCFKLILKIQMCAKLIHFLFQLQLNDIKDQNVKYFIACRTKNETCSFGEVQLSSKLGRILRTGFAFQESLRPALYWMLSQSIIYLGLITKKVNKNGTFYRFIHRFYHFRCHLPYRF